MELKEVICGNGEDFERLVNWITHRVSSFLERNKYFLESHSGFKDDLKSIVILALMEKREKLCKKQNLNLSYVLISVKHFIIDRYFKVKYLHSTTFSDFSDEFGSPPEERFVEVDSISPLVRLNAAEAVEKIRSVLTDRELRVLCYKFYSEVSEDNPFLSDKSQDARYKAWSRLKSKLVGILSPFGFSEEEFKYFVNLVVSEICEKIR